MLTQVSAEFQSENIKLFFAAVPGRYDKSALTQVSKTLSTIIITQPIDYVGVLSDKNDTELSEGYKPNSAEIRDFLEKNGFFSLVSRTHVFPTLHDAMCAARLMTLPIHLSISMNGYRDVITLSTGSFYLFYVLKS